MTVTLESVTPQAVLSLIFQLPPEERRRIVEIVSEWDEPLPESATVDEAIELYLADKCSLGRAADLAGITRWDLQEILYERGTPVSGGNDWTVEEMDTMIDWLEQAGYIRGHAEEASIPPVED